MQSISDFSSPVYAHNEAPNSPLAQGQPQQSDAPREKLQTICQNALNTLRTIEQNRRKATSGWSCCCASTTNERADSKLLQILTDFSKEFVDAPDLASRTDYLKKHSSSLKAAGVDGSSIIKALQELTSPTSSPNGAPLRSSSPGFSYNAGRVARSPSSDSFFSPACTTPRRHREDDLLHYVPPTPRNDSLQGPRRFSVGSNGGRVGRDPALNGSAFGNEHNQSPEEGILARSPHALNSGIATALHHDESLVGLPYATSLVATPESHNSLTSSHQGGRERRASSFDIDAAGRNESRDRSLAGGGLNRSNALGNTCADGSDGGHAFKASGNPTPGLSGLCSFSDALDLTPRDPFSSTNSRN